MTHTDNAVTGRACVGCAPVPWRRARPRPTPLPRPCPHRLRGCSAPPAATRRARSPRERRQTLGGFGFSCLSHDLQLRKPWPCRPKPTLVVVADQEIQSSVCGMGSNLEGRSPAELQQAHGAPGVTACPASRGIARRPGKWQHIVRPDERCLVGSAPAGLEPTCSKQPWVHASPQVTTTAAAWPY